MGNGLTDFQREMIEQYKILKNEEEELYQAFEVAYKNACVSFDNNFENYESVTRNFELRHNLYLEKRKEVDNQARYIVNNIILTCN